MGRRSVRAGIAFKASRRSSSRPKGSLEPWTNSAGVLSFGEKRYSVYTFNLSEKADLTEAAANLFQGLRSLDESNCEIIVTDYLPPIGLGIAINDRLTRAAAGK